MATLHEIKLALPRFETLTKKDLTELYGLALNTVTKTISACGLRTATEHYTPEEIEFNFHPAREMAAIGKTYKEIADHFGVSKRTTNQVSEPNATGFGQSRGEDGATAVDLAAFKMVNTIAETSMNKAVQALPLLMQLHLGNKLSAPEFAAQIDATVSSLTPSSEGINDFLLQGLDAAGCLPPTMQQQPYLLPSAD